MNDVAALTDGHWQWNGWLTAKGRVIALFALLRLDAQTLWLLLPDADATSLAESLRRFVFRSKVALDLREDLHANACFCAPTHARHDVIAHRDDDIELDLSADGGPRSLRLSSTPAASDAAAEACWTAFDLRHGLPRLPAAQAEQWTPQQLSLERLAAFSVKKGCYPGQEIVARTHFLGQAKRGLALLEGDAELAAGAEVQADGRAIGSLIACAGALALAVLPAEPIAALRLADGRLLQPHPLAAGLAR